MPPLPKLRRLLHLLPFTYLLQQGHWPSAPAHGDFGLHAGLTKTVFLGFGQARGPPTPEVQPKMGTQPPGQGAGNNVSWASSQQTQCLAANPSVAAPKPPAPLPLPAKNWVEDGDYLDTRRMSSSWAREKGITGIPTASLRPRLEQLLSAQVGCPWQGNLFCGRQDEARNGACWRGTHPDRGYESCGSNTVVTYK